MYIFISCIRTDTRVLSYKYMSHYTCKRLQQIKNLNTSFGNDNFKN